MKISILGTKGIPNNYGGFEQFAEYFSRGLVRMGHQVSVYTSHDHPYKEGNWNGVVLIHKFSPEKFVGSWGQFIYDFLCIVDSRGRGFDIILQLGYTSNSVWGWILPRKSLVITNMDGLEWKRSKYSKRVQRFLKFAEYLAIKTSDLLIADSKGIKKYLKEKYDAHSQYIPYGTNLFENPNVELIKRYDLKPFEYNLLIARMEPENNIETILDGVVSSVSDRMFLVIGSYETNRFGRYLKRKFALEKRIHFLGPMYDIELLNNLRYFSHLYFHGHSVGGTNPSLLEAMASNALICAHLNEFNYSILETDAFYFSTSKDVTLCIDRSISKKSYLEFAQSNRNKIKKLYLWEKIVDDYAAFFSKVFDEWKSVGTVTKIDM